MVIGRLHSIETMGLVDGPGIRTIFFLQGCPFHRAGSGAAPEGDGTNRRQKAHAFDGVIQKLCGRKVIRGAVRHIRPRDIILGW